MTTPTTVQPFRPDGFIIVRHDADEPCDFIDCTKNGHMRDKVEDGLLMRVDFERFYAFDSREDYVP